MGDSVYVETTIPSYLTAWPSRDLVRAAHQHLTREWWAGRAAFDLYTSRLVIEECRAGDPDAARLRLEAMAGIPILDQTADVDELVKALASGIPLPERARADAYHIAIAAVSGVTYLLTWNCTHIANVVLRSRIEAICRSAGYDPPIICTPDQLKVPGGDDRERG